MSALLQFAESECACPVCKGGRPRLFLIETRPLVYQFAALDKTSTKHALQLGIILAGQMDGLIKWTRSDLFTAAKLDAIPANVELLPEMVRVFAKICSRAYVDGVGSTARAGRPRATAALSKKAVKFVEGHGARLAAAALHGIRTQIMPILEATFTPDGTRVKPQEMLEKEIRSVYATMLRPGRKADLATVLEFAASDNVDRARDALIRKARRNPRRMKVRDPEQHAKWQARRTPHTKWMKNSVAQIRAEALAPPTLSPEYAVRWVETEAGRFKTAGLLEATRSNPEVVAYRIHAPGPTPIDQQMNGLVIRKDDPNLSNYLPPYHHGCSATAEPVYADEGVRPSARGAFPHLDLIAKGFGKVSTQAPLTVVGQR